MLFGYVDKTIISLPLLGGVGADDQDLEYVGQFKSSGTCVGCLQWGNKFKGVLHPSTKISLFCLFSPSSRGKLILFMYGCDKCNDSKSKSMIFFHWIYESLMWNGSSSIFSLLKSTEFIHLFPIVGIIPIL